MDKDEEKIKALMEKNEAMKRFILKMMGLIDLSNPEASLQDILEKRVAPEMPADVSYSFIHACSDQKVDFEEFTRTSLKEILRPFRGILKEITKFVDMMCEEDGLEEKILKWKKALEELVIIRKRCFQVLVKYMNVQNLKILKSGLRKSSKP